MRDSVDIFKDLVFNKINRSIKVKEIIAISPLYVTLIFCNDKYLKVGQILKYGDTDVAYPVHEYIPEIILPDGRRSSAWRLIAGAIEPKAGDTFNLPELTFVNGTRIVANSEWKLKMDYDQRQGLPLIWLHETIRENFKERNSSIERVTSYRFFLLDEVNKSDLNEGKRAGAVKPMYGLLGDLKRIFDSKLGLKRSGDIQVVSFTYFGTETQQGVRKNILDANLGGLEVVVDLEIFIEDCNC